MDTTNTEIDHAAIGREYADNLLGEPAVSRCLNAMADEILADEIDRLKKQLKQILAAT